MQSKAMRKVEGGKLVKIKVDHDNSTINQVLIEGDFFLHPETGVTLMEDSLKGLSTSTEVSELVSKLDAVVSQNKLELIGFSTQDVADLVKGALS